VKANPRIQAPARGLVIVQTARWTAPAAP